MTKFYNPRNTAKAPIAQPVAATMFPEITPELMGPLLACDEVMFTLTNGEELLAKAESLEDDGIFIYGNLAESGACFALPLTNMLYCIEAVSCPTR